MNDNINNSNDMENLMSNLNNMMKNGSLPDNIKNLFGNMNSANTTPQDSSSQETTSQVNAQTDTASSNTNSINPEMLGNIMKMFNSSNNNNNTNSNSNTSSEMPNIDINMLLKMKSIMEKMNTNKDDPRANLLLSLKPYLKESRKGKVEQYIQFFNISKVMDVFGSNGGEKTK